MGTGKWKFNNRILQEAEFTNMKKIPYEINRYKYEHYIGMNMF